MVMPSFFPSKVGAYSFTEDFNQGFYWESLPINLEIIVKTEEEGKQLAEIVEKSEQEWEDALGVDIWDIEGPRQTENHSSNNIRWSNNFGEETGYDPQMTLAVTVRYRVDAFFDKVMIILNGKNTHLRSNYDKALEKTVLHEMGHTFGLDHSDQIAIMQAELTEISELQKDDIVGGDAVLDETFYRQQTGYVSPLLAPKTREETLSFGSCGSIEFISDDVDHRPNLLFSLNILLGIFFIKFIFFLLNMSIQIVVSFFKVKFLANLKL